MWTFDNLPVERLQKEYGFKATPEWLEHVRLASVRFNDGGSGSFVSPTGLVLTNHHVAVGQLQKMSTPEHDYVKEGFLARTREQEIKCVDLELNVLVAMRNVTAEVEKAAGGLGDEAALKARKKEIARLESDATSKTGMRSEVVSLYHGGEYWLHTYKKYRDVRLVMAPEKQIAFFGATRTTSRSPATTWISRSSASTRMVPRWTRSTSSASTPRGRLPVTSCSYPVIPARPSVSSPSRSFSSSGTSPIRTAWNCWQRRLALLEEYAKRGKEERRRAATLIFGAQNGLKVFLGRAQGLGDPKTIEAFRERESALQEKVRRDPVLAQSVGGAWAAIEGAMKKYRERYLVQTSRSIGGYRLPGLALSIALYVNEIKKPDGERIDGFHQAQLDQWRFRVLSKAPVHMDLEELVLVDTMQRSLEKLGPKDPFVVALLGGKSPRDRARELIQGTRIQDPEFRRSLVEGGSKAVEASTDSLVRLARQLEPFVRENVKWGENNVTAVVTPASERIARARFRIHGKSTYPDATFTLRLSYGTVKGYPMNGTQAPSHTTFYGLYDRYYGFNGASDWSLPERFLKRQASLDLATPMNFVTTNDIIGGNSGSPVIDRNAALVGWCSTGTSRACWGTSSIDLRTTVAWPSTRRASSRRCASSTTLVPWRMN